MLEIIHTQGDHFYRSGINNKIYHLSEWHYGESSNQDTDHGTDGIPSNGYKFIYKDNIKGSMHYSSKDRKYNDIKTVNNQYFSFDLYSSKEMLSFSNSNSIKKDSRAGDQLGHLTGEINTITVCNPASIMGVNIILITIEFTIILIWTLSMFSYLSQCRVSMLSLAVFLIAVLPYIKLLSIISMRSR